jgi:hypothetical protein
MGDQDRERDHERVRQHNEQRLLHLLERHGRPRPWELERTTQSADEWRREIAAWIASLPERERQLREHLVRDGLPLVEEPDLEEPEDETVLQRSWAEVNAKWDAERAERMRKSAEWLRTFGIEVADDGWLNAPAKPKTPEQLEQERQEQEQFEHQKQKQLELERRYLELRAIRARVLGLTLEEYAELTAHEPDVWLGVADDRSLGEHPDDDGDE